jgi:hypothetical protein
MKRTVMAYASVLVAGALAYGAIASEARGADSFCNEVCTGEFPGTCTFTYQNYECLGANPPWYACQHREGNCNPE